jgi:pimeloyl-ACP methyl ester carboxylesterase
MTTVARPVQHVTVDGRRLAYQASGAGRAVVLVHGNFASKRWFRGLLERPPPGARLLALDLPNFGDSDPLGAPITMQAYADAVRGFVGALDLRAPVLVGHSLGGTVAMRAVGDAPRAFAALLLIDASAPDGLHTPEAHYPLLEAFRGNGALLAQALAPMMPTRTPSDMDDLVADALRMHPDAFTGNARALDGLDLAPALAAFTGPVRVLRGGQDALIDTGMAERTLAAFTGSRDADLLTWDDVGHSPNVEAPERVIALIGALIERAREVDAA